MEYIHSKTVETHRIIRKSWDFLYRKTSQLLYKNLILLHLDYCNTIYSCTSAANLNLNKLEILQNSACRTVFLCNRRTLTECMHSEVNLSRDRRDLHLRLDCHNHINNKSCSLLKIPKFRRPENSLPCPNLCSHGAQWGNSSEVSPYLHISMSPCQLDNNSNIDKNRNRTIWTLHSHLAQLIRCLLHPHEISMNFSWGWTGWDAYLRK